MMTADTTTRTTSANRSTTTGLSSRYRNAHRCLMAVLIAVTVYATGMVLAGSTVAIRLFDVLQFGPNARGLDAKGVDYAIFAFGVLGAVLIGWMILLAAMADLAVHQDRSVRIQARSSMARSVAFWFVWDTGFSLATGEWQHAAFNVPFVTLLMGPLYVMMCNDNNDVDAGGRKEQ
jgi:hypothetical protein